MCRFILFVPTLCLCSQINDDDENNTKQQHQPFGAVTELNLTKQNHYKTLPAAVLDNNNVLNT